MMTKIMESEVLNRCTPAGCREGTLHIADPLVRTENFVLFASVDFSWLRALASAG